MIVSRARALHLTDRKAVAHSARPAACSRRDARRSEQRVGLLSLTRPTGFAASPRGWASCRATKGGVADAPLATTAPVLDSGTLREKKRSPIYKLMLHNDNYNKREYVVKVLIKVVAGLTVDDAVAVMHEAHNRGVAMVLACPQEEAETYCESLRINGLYSSIEPGC